MKKLLIMAVFAALVTGCASTGDLEKVNSQVTKLGTEQVSMKTNIEALQSRADSLTQKQLQCLNHCRVLGARMDTYDSKLNSVFNHTLVK